MSYILRQGAKLGESISVVAHRGTCHSQPLNKSWPHVIGLSTGQLSPVRKITTTAGKQSVGAMGVFLLTVPIGTFCLGTWQVQRRQWKLNLIEELDSKTKAQTVQFPENLEELEDLEYRRVKIKGTFDHSREVLLGPRPLMIRGDVQQAGSGLISSGQSGFLVVTPFKLLDRDLTILVNRGWVPRKQKNPDSRVEGQVEGPVELEAVVRKTEKRAPFMPENAKGAVVFLYRDVPTMSQKLDTAPVFLDAVDTFPGGPQGGQTRVTMRNEHLSYLLTWYTLSLTTAYMWYRRFIRGKPLL